MGNTVCRFPETLDQVHESVCLCMCVSMCDGNVNSNRKWPVSHALTPALSPSCWSVRTHKQPHTDLRTDTHTAGLPVSDDLGWASEALHGFHIHSSPPSLQSELAPSSSFSFSPFTSFLPLSHLLFLPFTFIAGTKWRKYYTPTYWCFLLPPVTAISGQWCQSAGSQHKRMRSIQMVWIRTQSWSAVVLSWIDPYLERKVGGSALRFQITPDIYPSHQNILIKTLISDRICFLDSVGSEFEETL